MSGSSSAHPLALRLWQASNRAESWGRSIGLVALGTALLYASAKIQVPFYPVPTTMQTLVVLLLGAFYGPRLAVATLVAYLLEGAAGLPIFAGTPEKGLGLAYMMGPTGGYLAGFVVAAAVAGVLVAKGFARTFLGALAVALVAEVALYAFGVAWLGVLIGTEKAITFGLMPFLYAEALKVVLAASLMTAGARFTR